MLIPVLSNPEAKFLDEIQTKVLLGFYQNWDFRGISQNIKNRGAAAIAPFFVFMNLKWRVRAAQRKATSCQRQINLFIYTVCTVPYHLCLFFKRSPPPHPELGEIADCCLLSLAGTS